MICYRQLTNYMPTYLEAGDHGRSSIGRERLSQAHWASPGAPSARNQSGSTASWCEMTNTAAKWPLV